VERTAQEAPAVAEQSTPVGFELGAEPVYSGLITRGIGMTIDAAIVNAVALVVAAAVALISSILPGGQKLHALEIAIAAGVFVLWWIVYFTVFWSTTGQTPGDRVMHIRVSRPDGTRLHAVRAMLRLGGTVLAAIPLFAGFLPILVNERRRAFNDWLADTVVTQADPPPVSAGARTPLVHDRDGSGPLPPA
jgi:uncharacterized RDD family membrane protein YckC